MGKLLIVVSAILIGVVLVVLIPTISKHLSARAERKERERIRIETQRSSKEIAQVLLADRVLAEEVSRELNEELTPRKRSGITTGA